MHKYVLLSLMILTPRMTDAEDWRSLFSSELGSIDTSLKENSHVLDKWQPRQLGPTSTPLGAQHVMVTEPPQTPPVLEVILSRAYEVDTVVLVPAWLNFGPPISGGYAFPLDIEIDTSADGTWSESTNWYHGKTPSYAHEDGFPLVIKQKPTTVQKIRITIKQLPIVSGHWTLAIGEVFALSKDQNVALGASCLLDGNVNLKPIWSTDYLTDGWTPLGPPIDGVLPEYDGYFSKTDSSGVSWVQLAFDQAESIDRVIMHPVHARQGADYPGFAFPNRYRIDVLDRNAEGKSWKTVYESSSSALPPGNNPVTSIFDPVITDIIRVVCLESTTHYRNEFGLSEILVYEDSRNVPIDISNISVSGDDLPREVSILHDGEVSYGQLLTWPEFFSRWQNYGQAMQQRKSLLQRRQRVVAGIDSLILWSLFLLVLISIAGAGAILLRQRHQRLIAVKENARRLAYFFHDEVGSNLAAISQMARQGEENTTHRQPDAEDWAAVGDLANQSVASLRESLWAIGASQDRDIHVHESLHRMSQMLLPECEMTWQIDPAVEEWLVTSNMKRDYFLAMKEILTNISRHSGATDCLVTVKLRGNSLHAIIKDNGSGFDVNSIKGGVGLKSLRERIRQAGGKLDISSHQDQGTKVEFSLYQRPQWWHRRSSL